MKFKLGDKVNIIGYETDTVPTPIINAIKNKTEYIITGTFEAPDISFPYTIEFPNYELYTFNDREIDFSTITDWKSRIEDS